MEIYVRRIVDSFSEIVEITNRGVVEGGDAVFVSYIVTCNDNVINQVEHDSRERAFYVYF